MERSNIEELLRNTIDSSMDMIQVFRAVRDGSNEIVDFVWILNNKVSEAIYGDVIGKSLLTLNPGVIEEGIFDAFKQVVETGTPQQYEKHYLHEQFNGWFHQSVVKLNDGVTTTTANITERKKAERDLTESNNLLQSVFDVSLNPIAYHKAIRDTASKIIDFEFQLQNQEARRYTVGDRTGQRYSDAYPGIKDTVVFKLYCNVVESGTALNTEVQLTLKGSSHWFHLMAVKLGDGLVATALDITERKESEYEILRLKEEIAQKATDKYESLFNTIDEGLSVLELIYDDQNKPVDMRWVEANPAFERITGLKNVAGRLWSDFVPSEDYWLQTYDRVLKTGEPIRFENYHAGMRQWYRTHTSRMGGPESRVVANVFEDITERKQQEQHQAFLLKFSDALRTDVGADGVANRALQLLIDHLQLDRSYITSYYLDANRADLDYQLGNDTVPPLPDHFVLSDYPEAFKAIVDKTFVIEDELERQELSEAETQNSGKLGMRAMVAATLRKGGNHPLWSMAAISSRPRRWTQSEINLVEEVAERTWAALERAKAEDALRASEKSFQSIANLVPDLLWDSAPDGSTNWYNEQWLNYTGQNFEQAIGWGWVDAIHPEDREASASRYAEAVTVGKPLQQEHRIRRYDGEYRWFVVKASPLKDENGKVVKIYGAATDIHDRKLAEEALRESEEKFRTLFQTMDEGFAIIQLEHDGQGNLCDMLYLQANPSFQKHTGLNDPVGKRVSELMPNLEQSIVDMIQRTADTGEPERAETYKIDLHRWFDVVYTRIGGSGSSQVAALFKDITERKRQDEQIRKELQDTQLLQLISNHIIDEADPEVFYDVLLDSAMKLMSADFASIQLLDPLKQKLLLLAYKNFHPDSAKHWEKVQAGPTSTCGQAMATGDRVIVTDLEHPSFEMDKADYDAYKLCGINAVQSTPLISRLGTQVGMMSTHWCNPHTPSERELGLFDIVARQVADLFERDRSTAALREREKQLKDLLKLRDEFIGVASHELKTPVTSMLAYAEMAEEFFRERGENAPRKLLERIIVQIDRLSKLISHLLDTTQISEGKLKLHFETIDIVALVLERAEEIQRMTDDTISISFEDVALVKADKERIGQVVINLLSNAIKYSPKKTIINVTIANQGDHVVVAVRDQGYGIPEEDQQKIFERFFRVTANNMDTYPGMGLGLYITAQIVHRHGGQITVASTLGKGSVFSFTIPKDRVR